MLVLCRLKTICQKTDKFSDTEAFYDLLDSNVEMADFMTEKYLSQSSASADGCPQDIALTENKWFAMRVTYSREQKAQQLLQEVGVECYVPMHLERNESGERYVPVVHNLIFVHTSRKFMDDYKRRMEYFCPLRYMIDRSTGLPMVVRDKEMEDFMRVTAEMGGDIVYLDNPSAVVAKGTPIEIVCGPFKGVQGRLLRIRRDRKVVLQLAGIVAVAASGIPMEHCKVLQ